LDDSIAKLIELTKKEGLFDNSYFIFLSDNGGNPTSGGNNYPLRGLKDTLFEGGVRTPAFVYSPLLSSDVRGTEYNKMFHVSDWLPTILEGILGHEADEFGQSDAWYGVNQWDAMLGADETPRDEILLNIDYLNNTGGVTNISYALIHDKYKMIYNIGTTGWYEVPGVNETVDVEFGNLRNFLFDLDQDPYEETNLFEKKAYRLNVSNMKKHTKKLMEKYMNRCIWKTDKETYAWETWILESGYAMVPYMDNGPTEVELEAQMYAANPDRWNFEREMFGSRE
jgi:arylsulfatase A-like enzyme